VQSFVEATALRLTYTCASDAPGDATLVFEGPRAIVAVPNFAVTAMRGLSLDLRGPCDAPSVQASVAQLRSDQRLCAGEAAACAATYTDATGSLVPVCSSGAVCTCEPVLLSRPTGSPPPATPPASSTGSSSIGSPASSTREAATPQCACGEDSFAASVIGLPPPLVPYLAPGVGCETHVVVRSLLFSATDVTLTLAKTSDTVESRDVNVTLTLGGTAQRVVNWHIAHLPAMPHWLVPAHTHGTASKTSSEVLVIDVSLSVSAA
jgi:hypothetical protein